RGLRRASDPGAGRPLIASASQSPNAGNGADKESLSMRGIAVSASLLMAAAGLLGSAPTAGAYEAVSVTDGGSIKGKVVFNGTLPPKRKIVPTKDREVCGSGVREVDQIIVGGDKGVQDAVVYLKQVEKGKAWPKLSKTPEIDNVKCDFNPHVQV